MNRLTENQVGTARGVTLVELMVVIAILAILAGILSPTVFSTFERQRAVGAARDVANELRRARNQAVSRGEIVVVEITQANGGTLTTYATDTTLSNGTPACTTDAECANGATCQNGACYGEPARHCRQWINNPDFERQVATHDMRSAPGMSLQPIGNPPLTNNRLCFSPDGRVVTVGTGTPISGADYTCDGENLVLVIADADANIADIENAAECATGQDDQSVTDARDALNLFRIAVPFNGSIKVKQ